MIEREICYRTRICKDRDSKNKNAHWFSWLIMIFTDREYKQGIYNRTRICTDYTDGRGFNSEGKNAHWFSWLIMIFTPSQAELGKENKNAHWFFWLIIVFTPSQAELGKEDKQLTDFYYLMMFSFFMHFFMRLKVSGISLSRPKENLMRPLPRPIFFCSSSGISDDVLWLGELNRVLK